MTGDGLAISPDDIPDCNSKHAGRTERGEGGGVLNARQFVKQGQEKSVVIHSQGWGMGSPANSFSEEHDPISLTGLLLVGIASGSLARALAPIGLFFLADRQTDRQRGEERER